MKEDFSRIGLANDETMVTSGGNHYQSAVRKHIRNTAFSELKTKQVGHSKVQNILYEQFEKQHYLTSPLFTNEDVSTLSNLRSHTTRGIRANFANLCKDNTSCPPVVLHLYRTHSSTCCSAINWRLIRTQQ